MASSSFSSKEELCRTSMNLIDTAPHGDAQEIDQSLSSQPLECDRSSICRNSVQLNLGLRTHPDGDLLFSYYFDPFLPVLEMSALTPVEAKELCSGMVDTPIRDKQRTGKKSSERWTAKTESNNVLESQEDDNAPISNSAANISYILNNESHIELAKAVGRQHCSIHAPEEELSLPSATEHTRQPIPPWTACPRQASPNEADISAINQLINSLGGLPGQPVLPVDRSFHKAVSEDRLVVPANEKDFTERNPPPTALQKETSSSADEHATDKKKKQSTGKVRPSRGRKPSTSKLRKVYHCPRCDKAFDKKTNCKRHIDIIHRNIRKFECETCSKSFTTKQNLMAHKKTKTHNGRMKNLDWNSN